MGAQPRTTESGASSPSAAQELPSPSARPGHIPVTHLSWASLCAWEAAILRLPSAPEPSQDLPFAGESQAPAPRPSLEMAGRVHAPWLPPPVSEEPEVRHSWKVPACLCSKRLRDPGRIPAPALSSPGVNRPLLRRLQESPLPGERPSVQGLRLGPRLHHHPELGDLALGGGATGGRGGAASALPTTAPRPWVWPTNGFLLQTPASQHPGKGQGAGVGEHSPWPLHQGEEL